MNEKSDNVILDVSDLKMYFPVMRGLLRRKVADIKAVDGVSFNLKKDETLGLVGESGCGKTTIGRCVLGLYHATGGKIVFQGQDIVSISEKKLREIRRNIALIFQDPYSSLDPRQSAGSIVGEPLKIHKMALNKGEYKDRLEQLFSIVGLDPSMADRFPHEFSGGQRQRIGIARALACNPAVIVCDEPISALDVSIQAQVINLLVKLQDEMALSYLFIAHDLSLVEHISDRVAVMYLGKIVELAKDTDLYTSAKHPYTEALLSAVPIPNPKMKKKRILLEGEPPSPINLPEGCRFSTRCSYRSSLCGEAEPEFKDLGGGHWVSCHRY